MKASVADAAGKDAIAERDGPRHGCAHLIRDGHARQVPSRPPDHQLPIRHGHNVRRRSPTGVSKRTARCSPARSESYGAMGQIAIDGMLLSHYFSRQIGFSSTANNSQTLMGNPSSMNEVRKGWLVDLQLQKEFERLQTRSPWMSSYLIDGHEEVAKPLC